MIALLFSPLGKVAGIIGLIIAAALGFKVWLAAHDHAVTEALVQSYEKKVADAVAKEAQRQAAASKTAIDTINTKIASDKAKDAAQDAIREQEISEYEKRLQAAQRACLLDNGDLNAILHDGQSTPGGLGHH
jgi:hypothetical protein